MMAPYLSKWSEAERNIFYIIIFITGKKMMMTPYSSKWSEAERNILSFEGKWLAVDLTQVYMQNLMIIMPPYFPILIVISPYDDRPWLIVDNTESQ